VRNIDKILIGKPEGKKRSFRGPRRKWSDNMTSDIKINRA
jgi:hypothetical protein